MKRKNRIHSKRMPDCPVPDNSCFYKNFKKVMEKIRAFGYIFS
jgi:hypothetical protein